MLRRQCGQETLPGRELLLRGISQSPQCHMEDLLQPALAFIAENAHWAAAIMFIATFGESFALVGLLFPGSSLLIAAGALMASGALSYGPVIGGAVLGAVLGDAISYWLGRRFGDGIARIWP